MNFQKCPLISIVTISYNSEWCIEKTINSVVGQTYSNIEYLIIDGGSVDNTIEIIKKHEGRISFWVSEPDNGIYDAMNKAIDKATGEWIIFMNTDDEFANDNVVEHFVSVIDSDNDYAAYYGDAISCYSIGDRMMKALNLKRLRHRMAFSHQSVFIRTELMKRKKYSLKYKLAADYNFLLSIYLDGECFYYLDFCVSRVKIDAGASFAHFIESKKEVFRIHRKNGYGKLEANYYYWTLVLRFRISCVVKKIIPTKLIKTLLKIQ